MIYELFLEGELADIRQDLGMQLNFNIDDINKYGSRDTSFSKTIVLPGTAKNNKLLGFVGELGSFNPYAPGEANIYSNFNAAQTTKAELRANGLLLLKGVFRLTSIVRDRDMIEYEGNLFGELGGFIAAIGNKKLEDLDFSQYDHDITVNNIVNTWNFIDGNGFYYPLIDHGTYSTLKKDYDFRTFRPALYVKEYIDKIFQNSGYTYESTFLQSSFFQKLIIPNNARDFNILSKDQLVAQIDDPIYTTYQSSGNSAVQGILQYAWQDENQFYNTFTSFTGTNFSLSDIVLSNGEQYPDSILTYNGASSAYVKGSVNFECEFFNDYDPFYGSPSSPYVTLRFYVKFEGFGDNLQTKTFGLYTTVKNTWSKININFQFEGLLEPNKQFKIYFERQNNWIFTNRRVKVRNIICNANIESVNAIPTPVSLYDRINLNLYIPRNIMQKDFISWIIKMFNLYITEDKIKENHLIIKPYVEYYDLSSSIDWTYKIARDKPWQIKPMGMLNGRFFEYKFKEDSDYYNESYKKKFNQSYGDRLEDTGFQYAKDRQTIEIGFSPTPLVEYSNADKIVSVIYKKSKGNTLDQEERTDSNIRILMAKKITGVDNWYLKDGSENISEQISYYGYAGHFDDPVNPTVDINFGAASEIYFDPNNYPSNNLFNTYWSGYIAEIADKDSKILTCHVYLTELDIAQLDFSKFVFIDGVLWRINKIIDFDASSGELTKVELLKVIDSADENLLCSTNWTKENYKGTTYRNGDPILQATTSQMWDDAEKSEIGAWCYYNFDPANNAQYGKLYNWYALNNFRGFAPVGYRVPTIADWDALIECLGGVDVAGGKMKTVNIWNAPNTDATNSSNFNGVPGGFKGFPFVDPNVVFFNLNTYGYYWASNSVDTIIGKIYILEYNSGSVQNSTASKGNGYSVRLIKE